MRKQEITDMALQLKAAERYEVVEKLMQSLDKPDAEIDRLRSGRKRHCIGLGRAMKGG